MRASCVLVMWVVVRPNRKKSGSQGQAPAKYHCVGLSNIVLFSKDKRRPRRRYIVSGVTRAWDFAVIGVLARRKNLNGQCG